MGMFDWVTWRGREDWQTKDFDCNLDRLLILDDGRAIRQRDQGDSKPFPPGEPHGWIYVYASFDDDPKDDDFSKHWVEYRLKFTDGILVAAIPQSERAERWEADCSHERQIKRIQQDKDRIVEIGERARLFLAREIEQLHAAVQASQALAATRLQDIERLQTQMMEVNKALGIDRDNQDNLLRIKTALRLRAGIAHESDVTTVPSPSEADRERATERLATVVDVYMALEKKTPKELVDLVLGELAAMDVSSVQELLIEELCTRVHPNWCNEVSGESNTLKSGVSGE